MSSSEVPASAGLKGVTVLVTRPAGRARELVRAIRRAGGTALKLPLLGIQPPQDWQRADAALQRLDRYRLVLFTSANAVLPALQRLGGVQAWPAGAMIVTIGPATAAAVRQAGLEVALQAPEPYTSEALLADPLLQHVEGLPVLIVRGEGGRVHLGDTLAGRGARVNYAAVYRRVAVSHDEQELLRVLGEGGADVLTVTSGEALTRLHEITPQQVRPRLLQLPLVVASERQAGLAHGLGFRGQVLVASGASDRVVLGVLTDWCGGRHPVQPGEA